MLGRVVIVLNLHTGGHALRLGAMRPFLKRPD
jgi:hypothetical protein